MKPPRFLLCLLVFALPLAASRADPTAANAVNALGIDLLRQAAKPGENSVLSPYSIQMAMAMTCAGADGQTRDEMVRVLHYSTNEDMVNHSFTNLQAEVNGMMKRESDVARGRLQIINSEIRGLQERSGGQNVINVDVARWQASATNGLLTLTAVNRLYGQEGFAFRPAYLKLLQDNWQAPLELVDFLRNASGVTAHINAWVQEQTHGCIQNLIPAGALDQNSRLVVVNALYLKAPWKNRFSEEDTHPGSFHLPNGTVIQVPTMHQPPAEVFSVGYARRGTYLSYLLGHNYTIIGLPYQCPELQFVILMPDTVTGLTALEAALTPEMLADCTNLPSREADLYLPRFQLKPPPFPLKEAFRTLGMKTAFNEPAGSANFDRAALAGPDGGLYLSDVFHQTFLKLDELGTEASAGTATMCAVYGMDTNIPVEIHVDRPFLFAIQHRPSGACLFLGRVTDPTDGKHP